MVKWWIKEVLEPLMVLGDYALRTAILPHPLGDGVYGARLGLDTAAFTVHPFIFHIIMNG